MPDRFGWCVVKLIGIECTRVSPAIPSLVMVKRYRTGEFIKISMGVLEESSADESVHLHASKLTGIKSTGFLED